MVDGAPQIWDIPLSPAQRWALVQLAFHNESPKVSDAASGKKLRRALRAFGLIEIRDALRRHDKVNPELAESSTPQLHRITAENLECVLGWATVPRHTSIELEVGDVFDLLEAIKAAPAEYAPTEAAIFYNGAGAENWAPPADPVLPTTILCPSCKQAIDLEEVGAAQQP